MSFYLVGLHQFNNPTVTTGVVFYHQSEFTGEFQICIHTLNPPSALVLLHKKHNTSFQIANLNFSTKKKKKMPLADDEALFWELDMFVVRRLKNLPVSFLAINVVYIYNETEWFFWTFFFL